MPLNVAYFSEALPIYSGYLNKSVISIKFLLPMFFPAITGLLRNAGGWRMRPGIFTWAAAASIAV